MTNNITWRKKTLYKSKGRKCIYIEIIHIDVLKHMIDLDVFVDVGVLRLGSTESMDMIQRWFDKRTTNMPEFNEFTLRIHVINIIDSNKYYLPVLF